MKSKVLIGIVIALGLLVTFRNPLVGIVKKSAPVINPTVVLAQEEQTTDGDRFPEVSGQNLLGEKFDLPKDFTHSYNLVMIAYLRGQQWAVNTWMPTLAEIEESSSDFRYWEFPTIREMSPAAQTQLDNFMIAGIRDADIRSRTITLYLDVAEFNLSIGVPNNRQIQVLLLSDEGEILWREKGDFSPQKGEALKARLKDLGIF